MMKGHGVSILNSLPEICAGQTASPEFLCRCCLNETGCPVYKVSSVMQF